MKKVILGLLILILIVAAVAFGIWYVKEGSMERYAVSEGVPCPYSWKEQQDGTYVFRIDTSAYPEHRWSTDCYPLDVVRVSDGTAGGEGGSDTELVLTLTPLAAGDTYLTVLCEQAEPFLVREFEVNLLVRVAEDLTITVSETAHRIYDGVTLGDENGQFPYQWWTGAEEELNLLITDETGSVWSVDEFDAQALEVDGPFYRSGSCGFAIVGKLQGVHELTVYNETGNAIHLSLEVSEAGAVSVIAHRAGQDGPIDLGEKKETEALLGKIALPPQAVVTEYEADDDEGSVSFILEEQEWEYELAPGRPLEELMEQVENMQTESAEGSVGSITLYAFRFSDGVVILWEDRSGRGCTLWGDAMELDAALAAAKKVVSANG